MFDLTLLQLSVLLLCGFLVGFSKTAGISLSAIIIPLMIDVFPAKQATGILSLSFFIASFYAVYYYRHSVRWSYFWKLAPGVLIGLAFGALFMQGSNNDSIKLIIGLIILAMVLFNAGLPYYVSFFKKEKTNSVFGIVCGVLIGFSSIVANAGSPIMAMYLLINQEKKAYVIGTLATFFLWVDVIKIPINIWTQVVSYQSLKLNYIMFPLMLVGGYGGILFMKWISENRFRRILEVLSLIGGVKLIYRPLINLL